MKKKRRVPLPHYLARSAPKVYTYYPLELWEKLSDEEKQYVVRFTMNYEGAYFKRDGKDVLPFEERKERQHHKYTRSFDMMEASRTADESRLLAPEDTVGLNRVEDHAIARIDVPKRLRRLRK